MSIALYKRLAKLTIARPSTDPRTEIDPENALVLENLRLKFQIVRTNKKEPNKAQISVFNLSRESRARVEEKGAVVILEAGHERQSGVIFVGDLIYTLHDYGTVEWETQIEAADGIRAYQHSRVNKSYKGPVSFKQVAKDTAKALLGGGGLQKATESITGTAPNGYVAHGPASKELDRLMKAARLEWSIQDGKLQILKPGEGTQEQVIVLSSESGMIGTPEVGSPGKKGQPAILKVRSLLNSNFRPGRFVEIRSRDHRGQFLILKTTHTGDTHGNDWYTDLECQIT